MAARRHSKRPGVMAGQVARWLAALLVLVGSLLGAGGCALGPGGGTSPTSASATTGTPGSGTATTVSQVSSTTSARTSAPSITTATERPRDSTTTTRRPGPVDVPAKGKEYSRLPTKEKVVALTFDAAYDPAPLKDILRALDAAGAGATFFLTGEFAQDFPAEVRRIVDAGYPIGSHSYSHPDFAKLDRTQIRSQLRKTERLLDAAGAGDPRPLFRFPYGSRDESTVAEIGREGYYSIYWTIDTIDWREGRTAAEIRSAVLDELRPGAIVLMHVGGAQTAKVLPRLLADIEARGYRSVSLSEGLGLTGE